LDIKPLEYCEHLKLLVIGRNKQSISLARLHNIKDLSLDWHKNIILPSSTVASSIERLSLQGYTSDNLLNLPKYSNLEKLILIQSSISTIKGIDVYVKLSELELSYCLKLQDIAHVTDLPNLTKVDIEGCKKIINISVLSNAQSIKLLRLTNCGNLTDIEFIRKMKSLENFSFVKTNIVNGDLSPCLSLKWVGFINKKHYSHSFEEMEILLKKNR